MKQIFCNCNVLSITFDQFNASLLNKNVLILNVSVVKIKDKALWINHTFSFTFWKSSTRSCGILLMTYNL